MEQVPLRHVAAFISVLPLQDEATQVAPFGQSAQLPVPSQSPPSSPHVVCGEDVHTFFGSLTPDATTWQTPSMPLACPVFTLVHA
jgi:hypothetical protein